MHTHNIYIYIRKYMYVCLATAQRPAKAARLSNSGLSQIAATNVRAYEDRA